MNITGLLDQLERLERSRATLEDCSAVAKALSAHVGAICNVDNTFKYAVPLLQKTAKVIRVHQSFLSSEDMAHFLVLVLKETLPVLDCATLFTLFKATLQFIFSTVMALQNEITSGALPRTGIPALQLRLFVCLAFLIHFQHGVIDPSAMSSPGHEAYSSIQTLASSLCYACMTLLEALLRTEGWDSHAAGKQLICALMEIVTCTAILCNLRQVISLYSATNLSSMLENRNYTYTTVIYQYLLRHFLTNSTEHLPAMFLSNILKKLVTFTAEPAAGGAGGMQSATSEPSVKRAAANILTTSKAAFQDVVFCFYFFVYTFCTLQPGDKTPTTFARLTQDGQQRVSSLVRFAADSASPIGRSYSVLLLMCFLGTGNMSVHPSETPFKQMHDTCFEELMRIRGYEMLFNCIATRRTDAVHPAILLAHFYRCILTPSTSLRVAFILPKDRIGGKVMSFQTIKDNIVLCLSTLEAAAERLAESNILYIVERDHHVLLFNYYMLLSILGRFCTYAVNGLCVNVFSLPEAEGLVRRVSTIIATIQRCTWQNLVDHFMLWLIVANNLVMTILCLTTHAGSFTGSSIPSTRKVDPSLLAAISELNSGMKLLRSIAIEPAEGLGSQQKPVGFSERGPAHSALQGTQSLANCTIALLLFTSSQTDKLAVVNQSIIHSAATLCLHMCHTKLPCTAVSLSALVDNFPTRPVSAEDLEQTSRHMSSQQSSQRSEEELKSELQGEKIAKQQLQLQLKKMEEALSSAQQESDTRSTELQTLKITYEQIHQKVGDLEQHNQLCTRELSLKNTEIQLLRNQLSDARTQLETAKASLAQVEVDYNAACTALAKSREEAAHLRNGMQSISLIVSDHAGYLHQPGRHTRPA